MATLTAILRGVGRFHQRDFLASVFSFAQKASTKVSPARIQNAFGESTSYHSPNGEVFQGDATKTNNQTMSQFVEVVLSLIADTFLKFGQSENGFSSVGTALLPAMYFSVQSPKFLLGLPVPARILNLFARRKSDEAVQPNVQTDFVGVIRQGLGGDLAGKNGIPLPSPALDGDALDSSFQWTMPTNGNATNARYLQPLS